MFRLLEASVPCLFQHALFLSSSPPEPHCPSTQNLLPFNVLPKTVPLSLQVHEPSCIVGRNTALMSPSATLNKGTQLDLPVSRRFNPAYKNKSLMDCCPEVFILLKFPPESAVKFIRNGMEIIVSPSFRKPRVFGRRRQ